jgi:hypothetical protein
MQPYFLPYAGLFSADDECRCLCRVGTGPVSPAGWVHRNRLRDHKGELDWLTLPIAGAPVATAIYDIDFAAAAPRSFQRNLNRFQAARMPRGDAAGLMWLARDFTVKPVSTIIAMLRAVAAALHLDVPFVLDSDLGLPPDLRKVERIYAIWEAMGAKGYVKASRLWQSATILAG